VQKYQGPGYAARVRSWMYGNDLKPVKSNGRRSGETRPRPQLQTGPALLQRKESNKLAKQMYVALTTISRRSAEK